MAQTTRLQATIRSLRAELTPILVHYGLARTVLHYAYTPVRKLKRVASRLSPRVRRREAQRARECEEYDRDFQVETGQLIRMDALDVESVHHFHGHAYLGTQPQDFREMMRLMPIDHRHYVFIDYGCGKGRALLLASEWPFKEIIGVEFAPELHEIAEANLASFKNPAQQCRRIRALSMDAVEFQPPPEPSVLYFFNPFDERILSAVLDKVGRSLAQTPRDLWVGYEYPYAHRPLDECPFLELVAPTRGRRVYRSKSR